MAESYFNHGRGRRKNEERTEMKEEDMMRMKGRWARLGTVVRRRWKPAGGRRGGRKGDDEGDEENGGRREVTEEEEEDDGEEEIGGSKG